MRILMVGTRAPLSTRWSGIDRHIRELSAELRKQGHDVDVLESDFPDGMSHEWRPFWRLANRAHYLMRWGAGGYDLVHLHGERTAFFYAMRSRVTPEYILTCHSPSWLARNDWKFWPERWGVRDSRAVVALSELMATAIHHTALPRLMKIIPTGVDTDRFKPNGLGDPRIALGVGAIIRRKRWHLAARALSGTGIQFRIVGRNIDREYGVELARSGATLVGEVSDEELIGEYQNCGFLIHPSESETGSVGAVIQAQACGKPVIVSRASAPSVGELGCGIIANDDRFRDAARMLSENEGLRLDMGQRARRWVVDHYSWPVIATRHIKLYDEVLDR